MLDGPADAFDQFGDELLNESAREIVQRNIAGSNRVARMYDSWHGEIFSPVEQARLRDALRRAASAVSTLPGERRALDFGCGSGNLTRCLVELGYVVTAADVSKEFLGIISERWPDRSQVSTLLLDGSGLSCLADESFDLVATYSVLHHLPDYLDGLDELSRVTKSGGVLYVDHEASDDFWTDRPVYDEFLERVTSTQSIEPRSLKRFFRLRNYLSKVQEIRYRWAARDEGDIHVFAHDHVEWNRVEELLRRQGLTLEFSEDYLLHRAGYDMEVYRQYENRCWDVHVMAMKKP